MSKKLTLLGLDMAFANIGLALGEFDVMTGKLQVVEIDLIKTEADKAGKKVVRKNSDDLRRATEAAQGIRRFIESRNVQIVAAEVPTGAQSARAAWALGIAVGVLAGVNRPVIQVTPKEVKEITGDKLADKQDMIAWAYRHYPDVEWRFSGKGASARIPVAQNEHMADAIAALHAAVATEEFRKTVEVSRSILGA